MAYKLTELEAINQILSSIGESPINSLADELPDDAALAQKELHLASKEIQLKGWNFNTDTNYTLARDSDNKIPIPSDTLRVTAMPNTTTDVVQREEYLYDKTSHSYYFDDGVKCEIVWYLAFDKLPEAFRQWICLKATRRFQEKTLGSASISEFNRRDELSAQQAAIDSDTVTDNLTIFDSGFLPYQITRGFPTWRT